MQYMGEWREPSYTYEQQLDRQIADAERALREQNAYLENLRLRRAQLANT